MKKIKIYIADAENADCNCDVNLQLFCTKGSSSEYIIKKDERNTLSPSRNIFVWFQGLDNT